MKKLLIFGFLVMLAVAGYSQTNNPHGEYIGRTILSPDADLALVTKRKFIGNNISWWNGAIKYNLAGTINVVNVKDYGAIGNGTTEDRLAILAAVTALDTLGGTVYFPVGRYKVSTPLKIYKAVHLQGVPVVRFETSGGFAYEAGSVIVSGGNGISVISLLSSNYNDVQQVASSVSDLNFLDLAGKNDTLLKISVMNRVQVQNCSFQNGATGIKVDAGGDDASWGNLINNRFFYNNTGIYLDKGHTGVAIPVTLINGGVFTCIAGETGIYAEGANFSTMSDFKMDLVGKNTIGINWTGGLSSITDVKFEIVASDSTTIGILSHSSGLSMAGIGVQNNGYGVGIKIYQGASLSNRNNGNSITNSSFGSSGGLGVWVDDTTSGTKISNCHFVNSKIYLEAGSNYNQLSNITSTLDKATGLIDNSTNSTIFNYLWADGGDVKPYFIIPQIDAALTDNTPSDAEIDAATGLTPATAGKGYIVTIKDSNGTGLLYQIESDGTYWYHSIMAKAV